MLATLIAGKSPAKSAPTIVTRASQTSPPNTVAGPPLRGTVPAPPVTMYPAMNPPTSPGAARNQTVPAVIRTTQTMNNPGTIAMSESSYYCTPVYSLMMQ